MTRHLFTLTVIALLIAGCAGESASTASSIVASTASSTAASTTVSTTASTEPAPPPTIEVTGEWTALEGPLSARAYAIGAWTGDEVLVIGGLPEAWCPPAASCVAPEFEPLTDGAAYNPSTGRWRMLADAPTPLTDWAQTVMVDRDLYVLTASTPQPGTATGFLRYRSDDDRWETLPVTDGVEPGSHRLAVHDGAVLAYTRSDEGGERADLRFDLGTRTWSTLPDDPLPPSFDRFMTSVDGRLLLFAKPIDGAGGDEPNLAVIAELDPTTQSWTSPPVAAGSQPDPNQTQALWTDQGWALDGRVVFPWGGQADGGRVNGWDRPYPHGGIYDPSTGQWRSLPDPVSSNQWFDRVAGAFGPTGAVYRSPLGAVVDLENDRLVNLPPLRDTDGTDDGVYGRTTVAAGSALFTLGGETWNGGEGGVLAAAHIIDPSAVKPPAIEADDTTND